ncbi:MAG: hypothetical protein NTZ21_09690 [Actinobacteria bacterium]|nr:hypothetical protein [Actinomycetota bacterium]
MGGAWGDDPWRRHAYRWHDERGWTEHVSDGVTEALDRPGERPVVTEPSAPNATIGPVWIDTSKAARIEPEPVTLTEVLGSSTPPRRWPLAVLGMIGSFALGGWIFSGGDSDQPVGVSAVEDVVESTVMGIDVPVDEPAVVLPTTTEYIVPVAPSLPAPVTLPVEQPVPAPITIGTVPLAWAPLSDAERAARNDGAIDAFEQATVGEVIAAFGMTPLTPEDVQAVGAAGCQVAAVSPTRADFEAGLLGPISAATIPPLQWGLVAGVAGAVMCLDEFIRLGLFPTV